MALGRRWCPILRAKYTKSLHECGNSRNSQEKQMCPRDWLHSHADWFKLSLLFYEQNKNVQLCQKLEYANILKFKSEQSVGTQLPTQVKEGEEACIPGQNSDGAVYLKIKMEIYFQNAHFSKV